jgi:hypothetical protein
MYPCKVASREINHSINCMYYRRLFVNEIMILEMIYRNRTKRHVWAVCYGFASVSTIFLLDLYE